MKKLIALIATTCLALSLVIVGVAYSSLEKDFFPEAGNNKKNKTETTTSNNAPMYGRFICEEAGINVALYNDASQDTVDKEDSAAFFDFPMYNGMVLGDHNYQEFSKLPEVVLGATAQITTTDGGIISLLCVDIFDGHNTGSNLTDSEYNSILGNSDLTTYTCLDSCKNVRICQWDIIQVYNFSLSYNSHFSIDSDFSAKCVSLLADSNPIRGKKTAKMANKKGQLFKEKKCK